jgi:hypothetical protein
MSLLSNCTNVYYDLRILVNSPLEHQYSETHVMYLLFSLLRNKGPYMFRALLAHPQTALNKRRFVYCMRVMSVGCTILVQPTDITRAQYTNSRLCSAS